MLHDNCQTNIFPTFVWGGGTWVPLRLCYKYNETESVDRCGQLERQ